MVDKLKKFLIVWLIFAILVNNVNGQLSATVPVSDAGSKAIMEKVAGTLDVILTQLKTYLQPISVNTQRILENLNTQEVDKYLNDSLKYYTLLRQIQIYERKLEELKNETNDYKRQALEEAKTAGAYIALKEVSQEISCINPRIRKELNTNLTKIFAPYKLANRAVMGYFNKIPDCEGTSTEIDIIALKPKSSFFAFLQPFTIKPFLAQAGPPGESQDFTQPNISITPAFQETEDTIELNNLNNLIQSKVNNNVEAKIQEREKEIGTIKPYYEKCSEEITLDTVTDGGLPFCTDYKVYTSGEDFQATIDELKRSIANPNNSIYQTADYVSNLLKISESTSTPIISDSSDIFLSENLREKICGRFTADTSTIGNFSAYAQCLGDLAQKLLEYQQKIKAELERLAKLMKDVEDETTNRETDISDILSRLPPGCIDARSYLESTQNDLMQTKNNIIQIRFTLFDLLNLLGINIDQMIAQINEINSIIDSINSILKEIEAIFNTISTILKRTFAISFSDLLGINLSFLTQINSFLAQLPDVNILFDITKKFPELIDHFNNILTNLDDIIRTFDSNNTAIIDFQRKLNETFNKYDILSNVNRLKYNYSFLDIELSILEDLASRNPDELKNMGICAEESIYEGLVQSTKTYTQTAINQQPKEKFNLFRYLNDLFKPKIVEISNEK